MVSKEINGTEYEFDDNPSMGTVKDVQQMQMDLLMEYLDREDLEKMNSFDESEFLELIVEREGMEAVNDMIWSKSVLTAAQTISLATDEVFGVDDLDDMGARDFRELLDASEEALGGDADDFFEELKIGTNLNRNQVQNLQSR